ncbi:hypothetical protein SAY87_015298 [Trapa incisa]|uniref:glucan endo-1,3-beta-D-glucosidase n=1 Tax=Trapa incisa TaxID=236973 RepID=A0AAN7GXH3_9MYRT|nr:hypothetical protein SAY87_015298 [Trapa incisa]
MELCTSLSLLLLLFTALVAPVRSVASIGINYGQIANNLPSPELAVPLVKSIGATKVKLYDADPKVLCAFSKTGIEFTVGLGNEHLPRMRNPEEARDWVRKKVQPFLPDTKITAIAVGNEVFTSNNTLLVQSLVPVMENLHTALAEIGLDRQVAITTAHSLAVLETSYPPSTGRFRRNLIGCVTKVLDFHGRTGSPVLINAYPYFAYQASPKQVTLDFVLFQSSQGILDPSTNLHYDNMLFAQIDAFYSALNALGYKNLSVHVSETGWPSKGDPNEMGATPENAKKYNGNLIKIMSQKKGTPMRPGHDFNLYVFALFNENLKPGPASERYYGLFYPDGSAVYSLGILAKEGTGNTTSSDGRGVPSIWPPPPNGYLAITSHSGRLGPVGALVVLSTAAALIKLIF